MPKDGDEPITIAVEQRTMESLQLVAIIDCLMSADQCHYWPGTPGTWSHTDTWSSHLSHDSINTLSTLALSTSTVSHKCFHKALLLLLLHWLILHSFWQRQYFKVSNRKCLPRISSKFSWKIRKIVSYVFLGLEVILVNVGKTNDMIVFPPKLRRLRASDMVL